MPAVAATSPPVLIALLAGWALWARWRGRLYQSRALQRFALWMGPSGLVAILALTNAFGTKS